MGREVVCCLFGRGNDPIAVRLPQPVRKYSEQFPLNFAKEVAHESHCIATALAHVIVRAASLGGEIGRLRAKV